MTDLPDISDYPIETIRRLFPSLKRFAAGKPVAYFDGPGGSQVVETVINAMSQYMMNSVSNLGGTFPSSEETAAHVSATREVLAEFVNAEANEIAFGQNMTSLCYMIAMALKRDLKSGDEIVVTEIDHSANVDPWLQIASELGLTVRWIKLKDNLTLDTDNLSEIITSSTKIVAVSHASNGVGTINDVRKIADRAHEIGAITVIDAVHSAPHILIDREELGADIVLFSAYKMFSSHIGIAVIRTELFKSLRTYSLSPAPQDPPGKLETGTQNFEGIVGLIPAIEFISSLGNGKSYRDRLAAAYELIHSYESFLAEKLRDHLEANPLVKLYQAPSEVPKTPTIAFRVDGYSPKEISIYLADEWGIFVGAGHFYAETLGKKLNMPDGWNRVGMAPYNTVLEVDRLIRALHKLTEKT